MYFFGTPHPNKASWPQKMFGRIGYIRLRCHVSACILLWLLCVCVGWISSSQVLSLPFWSNDLQTTRIRRVSKHVHLVFTRSRAGLLSIQVAKLLDTEIIRNWLEYCLPQRFSHTRKQHPSTYYFAHDNTQITITKIADDHAMEFIPRLPFPPIAQQMYTPFSSKSLREFREILIGACSQTNVGVEPPLFKVVISIF